jgi:Zn-dependent peptidase ImmA (M78 family)/DNA-binding XRE family transcriptional regulator
MNRAAEPLVHPEQLRQAREAVALTPDSTAREIGVPEDTLLAWEAGTDEPSVEQVEALARIYGRSVDYFLAERPGLPREVFLRVASSELQSHLPLDVRKVLVEFEELCRYEWELERLSGVENPVLFSPQVTAPARELAEFERRRLGLDTQPARNLRDRLGQQGIRIFWLPLPEGFSGLSWWHKVYGPCILANFDDSPGRRVFTMAHEYAHLLASSSESVTICDLSEIDEERAANLFAALFLMPEEDLRAYWTSHTVAEAPIDAAFIDTMAKRYDVSREALAIRLEEIGLLPNAHWLLENAPRVRSYGKRRPNWRRSRGERFVKRALHAHSRGILSIGKLAELLGTDLRTAIKAVSEQGDA